MKIVFHIDMDAFFAAIEERERPELKAKPVIVGADPKEGQGRGVVSTANYEARKYGIKSAMPISFAWQACKKGGQPCVFLRPRFWLYEQTSQRIMQILQKYAERFEQVSVDEAFLIPKFSIFNFQFLTYKNAGLIAKKIKREILKKEKLTCSVGIGPNMLVAKIASGFKKPNGLTMVKPNEAQKFLDPLPIIKIPGIGPKTELFLRNHGVETISHLRHISRKQLEEWLGTWGETIYNFARGQDDREVGHLGQMKSLGRQKTFERDTLNSQFLFTSLKNLAKQVWKDAQQEGASFRTVELTVRFKDFQTRSRQMTLEKPANTLSLLEKTAFKLFLPFLDKRENPQKKKIRLLGIRVSGLV